MHSTVADFCRSPDRNLTSATQLVQQSALASGGSASISVIEEFQMAARLPIAGAYLDSQSSLACGGTHGLRRNHLFYQQGFTKTIQAGSGQNNRVVLARFELAQSGIHIAAQRINLQIGPKRLQLRLPPKAARSYTRLLGQGV